MPPRYAAFRAYVSLRLPSANSAVLLLTTTAIYHKLNPIRTRIESKISIIVPYCCVAMGSSAKSEEL